VGMFGEVGPEVLAVAAWVGRLAGGDAVGEFDKGQFGAAQTSSSTSSRTS
jgi:hypothetical protein